MATQVQAIQTGWVRIKNAQRRRKPGGLLRALTDRTWTDWLPIYCWLIETDEGLILVDTGETSRTALPGYFPRWHPYYRGSIQTRVQPKEEVGARLRALGFEPHDIRMVIMTHLHTDHAGGLEHFAGVPILVSETEFRLARGVFGKLLGYLPQQWPSWFQPRMIDFAEHQSACFSSASAITADGSVTVVPTPGHTPGHVSVLVAGEEVTYCLAGDLTYTQELLLRQLPDGVTMRPAVYRATMEAMLNFAESRRLVYLPSHDPGSPGRLTGRTVLFDGSSPQEHELVNDLESLA